VARSIAPLISQHDRSQDRAEAALVRMYAEFHVAYDRYVQRQAVGEHISIGEAWRRVCEGLIVVMDGEFVPCLERKGYTFPMSCAKKK
jgi:hypothetical protein